MSVIKSAHHEGKAIIVCPWCGRKWEGRHREYYTCSVKNGGCGGKFHLTVFKVKPCGRPPYLHGQMPYYTRDGVSL